MRVTEKAAYKRMKASMVMRNDRFERIENVTREGTPDVNGCFEGKEFWIEIKEREDPARLSSRALSHQMSTDQKNWFLEQRKAGGKAFIFIETNRRRILLSGDMADSVNSMTMQQAIDAALWHELKPMKATLWLKLRMKIINECSI